ncbi:fimbria/pilus periplasmic chaperone [Pseudomonas hygromyciniae]
MLSVARLIFNAQEHSASLLLSNDSEQDFAVRVWVTDRQADGPVIAPFIVMPALFSVPSRAEQVLRVMKTPVNCQRIASPYFI